MDDNNLPAAHYELLLKTISTWVVSGLWTGTGPSSFVSWLLGPSEPSIKPPSFRVETNGGFFE